MARLNERSFTRRKINVNKKIQILEATERILAKHGFERLSIQMVAKDAGVAAGTIYRYFADKNDLLAQLREHVLQECARKMQHGLNEELSLKQQFITIWRNTWQLSIDCDDNAINREQFESLPYQKNSDQKHKEREIFTPIHQFFLRGIRNGTFKALPTDVLSSIGIEPALFLARKQINGVININASELESVLEACWDAICLNKNLEQSK